MTRYLLSDRDDLVSVVIVGGGYAGMMASNRLLGSLTSEERARVRVTIINPTDRFVHRIRLHEHAAGIADAALELRSMIHAEVTVVIGRATSIDTARQIVLVDTAAAEHLLAYDWLVYAVGSRSASQVPGAARYAVPIGDIDGASDIARRFAAKQVRRVCVVGGGPAGVETAAELAEAHQSARVTLLAGQELVAGMRVAARRSIRRRLQRLGVVVEEGVHVAEVTPHGVKTVGGTRLPFDLVVWAAGFEVPDLAARSGLPVDQTGRLLVDETLACITEPRILGAGDAVRAPDAVSAHLPMGARTALPLGGAAADTLLARLRHEVAQPISIGLLGPSISIGRHDGYIQLARPDDSPRPIAVTGRLGAAIKAWVCRMTIDRPRDERTRPGAYRVPDGPKPAQRHRSSTAATHR
ncbi:NAD(P)/FAD-dependent oxidoreductase [Microbacterium yannicii]|uniref:NAD(P)/FAD-dependent oxidoreductase n=1 Tax=Microbacterium yannicii TaxID=671622 RepID=UPI000360B999|nr:FAD-dependent oxidoreductase [Microbacterium yannicii]